MSPPLVRVLPSAELPVESRIHRVAVAGTAVLLGRLADGTVVAFAATCPHQQTDLTTATFDGGGVRCPLHGYTYDPHTGENVLPAGISDPAILWKLKPGYLPVFPVEERDGWIWVGQEPRPPPSSYDPEKERPPHAGAPADRTEWVDVVRVAAGATFELRLPTTPRPGFVWRVEAAGALLAVVEERSLPGHPPLHLVRVTARREGETTLRCLYARPWDRDPVEVRTYRVRIGGHS